MKKIKDIVKVGNYGFFLAAMLLFGMAFGLMKGVQDNYLAEILHVEPFGRGVVEFFRELPGLLLLLILALFYRSQENRILRYSFMIALVGIFGLFMSKTNLPLFVFFMTVWSMGEHLMMPVRSSYAVHSAQPGKEGSALGLVSSVGNIGQVAGYFLVPVIFLAFGLAKESTELTSFRIVFFCIIIVTAIALILTFKLREQTGHVRRDRISFKRKFTKFYFLEMFYGGRKQVFLTFGPYVLILHYGAPTELIASLLGVCAVINIFFTPVIGKIIDRIGYKKVMVLDTVFLFFVCLTYGFAHRIFSHDVAFLVVCGTFILDWMISSASMAAHVYVSRISDDRAEMTSALSTGISINHLISVAIALAGGLIWESLGIELLFILAACMAVGNTLFAMTIPQESVREVSS